MMPHKDLVSETGRILYFSIPSEFLAGYARRLMELGPFDDKNLTLRDDTGDKIFPFESILPPLDELCFLIFVFASAITCLKSPAP